MGSNVRQGQSFSSKCMYNLAFDWHHLELFEVGTHKGTSPYDFSLQLKCLHELTGHRDLSHEQFTRSVLRNQVAGTCSKNSNWFEFIGLVVRLVGTKLSATRFWSKNGQFCSSHEKTCLCPRREIITNKFAVSLLIVHMYFISSRSIRDRQTQPLFKHDDDKSYAACALHCWSNLSGN